MDDKHSLRQDEPAPAQFQDQLAEQIRIASEIDVERFDVNPSAALTGIVPQLRSVWKASLEVLAALGAVAGAAAGGGRARKRWALAAKQLVPLRAFRDLEDLTFIVAGELRAGCRQLEGLDSEASPFGILAVCEQFRSKLIRGLSATEAVLSGLLVGRPSTVEIDFQHESLAARRLITRFRERVAGARDRHSQMVDRLRVAGNVLAWLRGHDGFCSLPASDRLVARQLQQRTGDWLRSGAREGTIGVQLDQELAAFATLLTLVNRRPELVEHDCGVIEDAIDQLASTPPHDATTCSVIACLDAVRGRDDVLDRLLVESVDNTRVQARLVLLLRQLKRETSHSHNHSREPELPSSPSDRSRGYRSWRQERSVPEPGPSRSSERDRDRGSDLEAASEDNEYNVA